MAVSKKTRFDVFKRDSFTCSYCGRTPPTVILHVDHIHPTSKGGSDDKTNLTTSCLDCNLGKSAGLLGEVSAKQMDAIKLRQEEIEQLEAFNKFLVKARKKDDEAIREIGIYWFNHYLPNDEQGRYSFGVSRVPSIRGFLKRLPVTEIYEAMELAHQRVPSTFDDDSRAWKYFCGVCWKKIKDAEQGR